MQCSNCKYCEGIHIDANKAVCVHINQVNTYHDVHHWCSYYIKRDEKKDN